MEYYTTQSVMTDPGKYAGMYEDLPDDIPGLIRVVQGVLLHVFWTSRYGVELSEEREKEVNIRKVEDMLERILELDANPITAPRELDKRLVGNCRDFSIFICSFLRHKGIPARPRCGFGAYFLTGKYADHWICEYWDTDKERWIQLDAQLDSLQIKTLGIEFDPLTLPEGEFLTAGQAWKFCRAGKLNPDKCGFFDPQLPHLRGYWFIKDNMIRDFMALNKVEILPWDTNNSDIMGSPDGETTESQYSLLDKVAHLTTSGDSVFTEVRELYESDSSFRMPEDWKP